MNFTIGVQDFGMTGFIAEAVTVNYMGSWKMQK